MVVQKIVHGIDDEVEFEGGTKLWRDERRLPQSRDGVIAEMRSVQA